MIDIPKVFPNFSCKHCNGDYVRHVGSEKDWAQGDHKYGIINGIMYSHSKHKGACFGHIFFSKDLKKCLSYYLQITDSLSVIGGFQYNNSSSFKQKFSSILAPQIDFIELNFNNFTFDLDQLILKLQTLQFYS